MGGTFDVVLHTQMGILVGTRVGKTATPGFVGLLLKAVLTDGGWRKRPGNLVLLNERVVDAIVYEDGTVGQEDWGGLLHL